MIVTDCNTPGKLQEIFETNSTHFDCTSVALLTSVTQNFSPITVPGLYVHLEQHLFIYLNVKPLNTNLVMDKQLVSGVSEQ